MPPARGASTTTSGISLLIVEDSAIVRRRLVELVSEVPLVSIIGAAATGGEALDLFREYQPDAVLLDLELPGISGIELIPRFKEMDGLSFLIVLTTYAIRQIREHCLDLGADCFLSKSTEFARVPGILRMLDRKKANGRLVPAGD